MYGLQTVAWDLQFQINFTDRTLKKKNEKPSNIGTNNKPISLWKHIGSEKGLIKIIFLSNRRPRKVRIALIERKGSS
jgi:hypothetical protein